MGVFRKLKDVLFDVEEDDEIEAKTETQEIKKAEVKKESIKPLKPIEENTIKEIKIPKEELAERELIKSESTFNFPLDVDDEPVTRRPSRSIESEYKEPPRKRSTLDLSKIYDEPKKPEPKREPNKPFRPTPIISPVYGILDQNYSKDDIVVKTETGIKGPDLDMVRKKAYGIENKDAKKESEKAEEATNARTHEFNDSEEKKDLSDISTLIKEDSKEKVKPEKDTKINSEDTLETDLFKLIDSMYEEKEEEVE